MARRRVNTRFLTIFVSILVGLWVAVYAAQKLFIHEHPQPFIDAGDEAMRQQHWAEAAGLYAHASQLDPKNLDVCMKLGTALQNIEQTSPDLMTQERNAYEHALEVNPAYMPAIRALIRWYQVNANPPTSWVYSKLIDYSQRGHELDPSDMKLAAVSPEMVVQEWIAQLITDPEAVQQAVSDLRGFLQKNPSDPDVPYYIAKANINQALELTRLSPSRVQPPEASALYAQSVDVFDKLIKGDGFPSQDSNASMHHRFGMILEDLGDDDQSGPDVTAKYRARAKVEIERARALVRPKDPEYLVIVNSAIDVCVMQGDIDGAIRICRTLPPVPMVQLRLAQLMAASDKTRPAAERLLDAMLASLHDDPTHPAGVRLQILIEQANFEIYDYGQMPPSDRRTQLMNRIQDQLNILLGAFPAEIQDADGNFRSGVPIEVRRIQVRSMLLQGQFQLLVQTFNPLIANDQQLAADPTIQRCMADSYASLNQISRAIEVLQGIVDRDPRDYQSRKELVRFLVRDAPDKAGALLTDLMRVNPNDPDLVPRRIQYMLATDPEHNRAEIARLYPQLSEANPELIIDKARVAAMLKNYDEAIRLMNLKIAANPNDPSGYANLGFVYLFLGKKDQALDAINRGIAAVPDNPDLKLLIPAIKGEDPKIIEHLREQLAAANPDPLQRELELASVAKERGDAKAEEQHLKAAEAASPQSPRVWNELFDFYLDAGRPDDAAPYVDKLASVDYDQAGGAMDRYLLARRRNDLQQAHDIASQLTQDKPEYAMSWIALGQINELQGSYDEAMVDFSAALDRQSDNLDAYRGLITCAYALHRIDDAKRYIDDGLRRLPGNQALRGMLVDYVLAYGNPPDAIQVLQDQIKETPGNPQLYAALGSVYVRVARIAQMRQQNDQANQMLQTAVDMLEQAATNWPDEPEIYLGLTDAALAANQPADAERILLIWSKRAAWRLRPEPHVRLADLYERTNHPDAAESELRTALVRSDYSVELEIQMAELLTTHHKYDEALELLRGANVDQPAVRKKVIEILIGSGRTADAEAQIQQDLQGNPPDRASLYGMWAELALRQRNCPAAVDRATQSLALDSNDMNVVYTRALARLYSSPPDTHGAIDDLKRLEESQPNNTTIRQSLISAYMQLNMVDDAATELQAELRTDPLNKTARLELAKIYCDSPHPRLSEALNLLEAIESTPPFDTDPEIYQGEALILEHLHDIPTAMEKSDKALSLAPNDPDVWRSHLTLMLDSQDYQDTIDAVNHLDPKMISTWWALLDRSQAEQQTGDATSAAADAQSALSIADTAADCDAINQIAQTLVGELGVTRAIDTVGPVARKRTATELPLALMYLRNHDSANAQATIQSAMTTFAQMNRSQQIAALVTAGKIYQAGATPALNDRAYDAYQQCLKLDPTNLDALNNLACLLADNYSPPRVDEGMTYAQKAADLVEATGRPNATILDTQGWLLILSGSPAQGVDLINKALDLQTFPDAYLHLGEGYLALQYPDEADKQAQLGLAMVEKQDLKDQDVKLKTNLQNLIDRSEEMMKSKQQAQVP